LEKLGVSMWGGGTLGKRREERWEGKGTGFLLGGPSWAQKCFFG